MQNRKRPHLHSRDFYLGFVRAKSNAHKDQAGIVIAPPKVKNIGLNRKET
jgi:hypothetical protein